MCKGESRTYDPVHSEEQVDGRQSTHVGAQAVADAGHPVQRDAAVPQEGEQVGHTPCHGLHVVHSCSIARRLAEGAPVHGEDVVAAVQQVR